MPDPRYVQAGLKDTILSVISPSPDRARVNCLVEKCRALAASFLGGKSSAGLLANLHGVSINDLAYDCIADLFRQDAEGNYLELRSYFEGLPIHDLTDDETLPHVRRLVFSKVNQGVYRLYTETDPSLSKILRNTKLAISALKNFTEIERFGETCIAPGLAETLEHLPPFDRDELERHFFQVTTGRELIPQLLARLSLLLREQDDYCRVVPLISVGILFRKVYEEKRGAESIPDETEMAVGLEDALANIRNACNVVRAQIRTKYIESGKVTESLLCSYFKAIEAELSNRTNGRAADELSLFSALKSQIPDLRKEEYMEEHRSRLEYIRKLVGARVAHALRRDG